MYKKEAVLKDVKDAMARYQVLHFSTHGSAGFVNSSASGLTLAQEEGLFLSDIETMHPQNARLVVLSACETAIPGTQSLDEVRSLPSGLLQAGVPGVVGSLWAVSQLSTALLNDQIL